MYDMTDLMRLQFLDKSSVNLNKRLLCLGVKIEYHFVQNHFVRFARFVEFQIIVL